jgi:hypothetical protein
LLKKNKSKNLLEILYCLMEIIFRGNFYRFPQERAEENEFSFEEEE